MKLHHFTILGALIFLGSCGQKSQLILTNSGDHAVYGKQIVVDKSKLSGFPAEYFKLLRGGSEIPVQFDDLDKDGQWDEVAFKMDFAPAEEVVLVLSPTHEVPEYDQLTNVYLGVSPDRNGEFGEVQMASRPESHVAQSTPYLYQYEGPGWESELVGFRSYFDSRNGKDIFGKVMPQLYIHQIGLGENYHELADWGMDVLKVGNSLGAGALAMLRSDSLYRLGDTQTATFSAITEGPVRAMLELQYTGWDVAGVRYDVAEKISIWAGKRHYTSTIALDGGGDADTLVTGIVDLKKVEKTVFSMADYQAIFTFGEQSENHDNLGMGLLISNSNWNGFGTAPEAGDGVTNTYTAYLKPDNGLYQYHFFAGWELENREFASSDKFREALEQEVIGLSTPVDIQFQIKK